MTDVRPAVQGARPRGEAGGRAPGALTIRIGAKVPSSGPLPGELGIPFMARTLEEAGFESLWVSDHVVLPASIASRYPFSSDGKATWPETTPYVDSLIALALIASATERATIGTAVLVLPLRQPVVLAKQAASLDLASGGRLTLGVGAGWLSEEFEALGVPFAERGARFVEWLGLLRDCWTGTPPERRGEHYRLPAGVQCFPTPLHEIPLLVGGHSRTALRRAGTLGDGWLAHRSADALDPAELAVGVDAMRRAARDAGRDPEVLDVVLRIVDSAGRSDELARQLPSLAAAGVREVVVDVRWDEASEPARELAVLADAALQLS